VFAFVTSGWSSDASWSHPGGIRWKMRATSPSRNTCSNAPAAQLGALIHEQTGDAVALEWSLRIYDWVRATLLGGEGLYFDRIEADGTVSYEVWSYNQGAMIGAGVLLHRITGEQGYLDQAIATATAAIKRFTVEGPLGESRPAFSAVLVRNLFLLGQVAPDPSYRQLAEAYGEQMWMRLRDPRTGLFGGDLSVLNNSAPMLEIYALLGGATPHP
jgi:predicted alpha-1,6-mannanase (GH76 family)